jgi:Ca2+:H+ antiporter
LILALFILAKGAESVVKAQITGSLIGNSLLGLGLAALIGGWGRQRQRFSRQRAGMLSSMLLLCTIALLVPALFDYTERGIFATPNPSFQDEQLSLGVSIVLILIYFVNLVRTLVERRDTFNIEALEEQAEPEVLEGQAWPLWQSIAVLVAATIGTAIVAEEASGALEAAANGLGLTTFFLGVIVLAVVGNASEYLSAVYFARRNQMDLVMTITLGSTIQVALLLAPLLVIVSFLLGRPMNLVFTNPLELIAIASTAFIVNAIAEDGETTWFEGLLLLAVYALLALAFLFATPA